jgi:hypothetical protein
MKEKTRAVSVRINENLYESIARLGKEERRSISNMINLLLEIGVSEFRQMRDEPDEM